MTTNVQQPLISERDKNRQAMPLVAAFVADMRKVFGNEITVTFASENGIEKGTKGPEGIVVQTPERP